MDKTAGLAAFGSPVYQKITSRYLKVVFVMTSQESSVSLQRAFKGRIPQSNGVIHRLRRRRVELAVDRNAAVLERGGSIHTEPYALGKSTTIMFVDGPDGILFEFAGPLLPRLSN